MKDEIKTRLQGILDRYSQRQMELRKRQEETHSERKAFLESFSRKVSDTIRPTFEEVGRFLKSRGHGFEISQKAESLDSQGNIQSARIQLEILPDGYRARAGERPTISFIANSIRQEVWTHVSTLTSGCAGQRNVYRMDEITGDVVEEEILVVLASCFGG